MAALGFRLKQWLGTWHFVELHVRCTYRYSGRWVGESPVITHFNGNG